MAIVGDLSPIGSRGRAARLPRALAFAALGAVAGLGVAPWSMPVATLAALAAAFWLARDGRAGFRDGWALGAGWFALTLHWIVEPFLVEPARTGWMAPFALLLTAGGFALFWGAAFALARRLRLGLPGLVALWAGAEMGRSLVLTGFPWALVGHVWTETPVVQLVAVVGVHGLTLLTLGAAALLAARPVWGGAAVAALAGAGLLLDPGPAPAPDAGAPLVRLVQPDVPQAEKWDPALAPGHLQRLLDLSGGDAAPDLVVWPETAITEPLDWAGPVLAAGSAAAGGATVATGVVRRDEAGNWFNSLAVWDGGRVLGTYDKAHLVPFGEYIPLKGLLSRWGLRGLAEFQGEGFASGPGAALLDLPGIGPVRPLVCYEGIFAEEIGRERPRALLLVTNDAWFGERAGPLQHFALGRLRAVEQGLPMLRAANMGVSAVIDGRGRVLAALPLHEAGAIDARLPPALPPTPYARTGDWPAVLALALLAALAFRARTRRVASRDGAL